MATTQHYLWAGGHFLFLASAFRYLIAWITFKSIGAGWYRASFLGALLSYAIVCYKSLQPLDLSIERVKRLLLTDENVQYLLLAFYWWSSKPVAIALIPYFIFSLFHALTFTRTTLMPRFLPAPVAPAGSPSQAHPLAKRLQLWVKDNYDTAMRIVAYTELAVLIWVILGALTFRNSLVAPLGYAHFIRQRYHQSAFTRAAFANADATMTQLVVRMGSPLVTDVWDKARVLIERYGGVQRAGRAQ